MTARIAATILLAAATAAPHAWAQTDAQAQDFTPPNSFRQLALAKMPAVASIVTTQEQVATGPSGPFGGEIPPGMEEFFERFGEDFFDRFFDGPEPPGPLRGLGSGFVIDPEGYVVTNAHVIENASEIEVVFDEGPRLPAEVVGTDERTDLALLRVEPEQPLPALEWGDSAEAQIGDWVMAIGNPFGLGASVTTGVVSARARDIQAGPYDDFIQTDAAINQGNSGGPLLGMNGRVVGVNTAIFSPTGGSVGIGFAIPASIAEPVITQLRETGTVRRGWLGVQIQTVTEDIAQALGLEEPAGALVASVIDGAPAAEAGFQPGDVILSFAGTEIEELRDLTRAVADAPVGEQAETVVWRNGERVTLTPEIALLEEEPQPMAEGPQPREGEAGPGPLGMALAPLTPELRARFDIGEDVTGVLVVDVEPGSPAYRRGLLPGDVIMRVGNAEVTNPQQVAQAIEGAREAGQDSVLILRRQEDQQSFVPLPVEEQAG